MDHRKYHAIRDAALASHAEGNTTAIAAVIEGGDELYLSQDWTNWDDKDRVVYGILTGLALAKPDVQGRAALASREVSICHHLLDKKRVEEIAALVWRDIT